jgi:hypothetical protein
MRKKSFQERNSLYRYYKKFCNLQKRISYLMQSGRFFDLSREIQHRLIRRLKLLYERVQRLAGKQKLKWAGAAFALIISASVAKAGFIDPVSIGGIKVNYGADPTFVDMDDDGDLDIVVGDYFGNVNLFLNNGGTFTNYGVTNPFSAINVSYFASPTLADLDDDGDLDLVVGEFYGTLLYFKNDAGTFTQMTGVDNPFDGIDVGYEANPTLVDLDGDTDYDLVVGAQYGTISYFENQSGSFVELTGGDNPFDGIDIGAKSVPGFIDYDNDGDLDLYIGDKYGGISYYINDGGTFTAQTGADNPFDGLDLGNDICPYISDFDNDGDLDIAFGDYESLILRYLRNDADVYTEQRGTNNPFEGVQVDGNATPWFADLDEDTDLDIVIGDANGNINYYMNEDGAFIPQTGSDNPFDGLSVNMDAKPTLGDIDDDGDLDLVVGDYDGIIHYFVNDAGSFTELTGVSNPFDGIDVGYYSLPTLADFDNDGDLDLFVGEKYGSIAYYKNVTGTYVQQTGVNNPFDGVDIGYAPALNFVDYDNDGDLDVFIGEKYGSIQYFQNDAGVLTQMTGTDNPLNGILVEGGAMPSILDADGDGDLDAYIGGTSLYLSKFLPDGIHVDIGSGLITTEAGGTAIFSVVLQSQPSDDVIIGLSSSDVSEGTVNPASLTFTHGDWNVPQFVTITGVDDSEADGNQDYTINFDVSSTDPGYDGMSLSPVSVTNTDNEGGVGIESISTDAIQIYSFDKMIVVNAGENVIEKVEILDIAGGFVVTQSVNSSGKIELPVYQVQSGIYIVRAYNINGNVTMNKVVIR